MRLLTVIAEMGTGGAERVAADLAAHAVTAGHEVCVASSGGWRADALAASGVGLLALPLRERGPGPLLRSARRLRAHPRVDVVHAHNVRAALAAHLGTRLGRRERPGLVTTVHGLAESDYPRAARLLRVSDRVVAVSEDVADRLVRAGLERRRTRVIENAVPLAGSSAGRREEVRGELGLRGPVVLCVARLAPPKRLDLLLDAWPAVPGATLLVAGDGPDRESLERRAGPVADRVRFLGARADVDRLLAAADALVLPTDREGLPMAVLEALASGVPAVASAVGALPELGAAVELVEPGRPDALAAGVRRVLEDAEHRTALVAAGRALMAGRFSTGRMLGAYAATYDALRMGVGSS